MNLIVFLFGCIGFRLFLTYLAKTTTNPIIQRLLIIITGLIGIGFLTIYFFGLRKTGIEVGGRKIWWNNLRPIHGLLYVAFSIAAYNQLTNAWILLLIDTIFGLYSYLYHYGFLSFLQQ